MPKQGQLELEPVLEGSTSSSRLESATPKIEQTVMPTVVAIAHTEVEAAAVNQGLHLVACLVIKQNHNVAVIVFVMHNFVAVEELRAMLDLCSKHFVIITI